MKIISFALFLTCTSALAVKATRSSTSFLSKLDASSNINVNGHLNVHRRRHGRGSLVYMQNSDIGAYPTVVAKGGDATIAASTFNLAKCKLTSQRLLRTLTLMFYMSLIIKYNFIRYYWSRSFKFAEWGRIFL